MEDYTKLLEIKKKIDRMKQEADSLKGKEELLIKQLKEISKVSTVEDAEEKVRILTNRNIKLKSSIRDGVSKIERIIRK